MRLLVVPISFRETMVYCQRTTLPLARSKPRIDDRLADKAANFWNKWKTGDVRWKQTIVKWTDTALERISYDEWSLKTIPARSAYLRRTKGGDKADSAHVAPEELENRSHELESLTVEYPSQLFTQAEVRERLSRLSVRGMSHHRKYMWISAIGAPMTLPLAAIPVIPNLPGFYLLFRAWSNWKALEGAKHLEYLVSHEQLDYQPSKLLNDVVGSAKNESDHDHLLLKEEEIEQLAEGLGAKEMASELHRALHQVKARVETRGKA